MLRYKIGALLLSLVLVGGLAMADDDLLGKKGGKGGGGGHDNGGGHQGGGGGGGGHDNGGGGGGGHNNGGGGGGGHDNGGGGGGGGHDNGGGGKSGGGDSGGSGGNSGGGGGTGSGRTGGNGDSVEVRRSNDSGDDGFFRKANGHSRSGQVQYGTVTNARANGNDSAPQRVGSLPTRNEGRIRVEASRENRIEAHPEWRSGYNHYSRRWHDDFFWYPYYVFVFDYDRCVPSFCYWYPHLPAYVLMTRVDCGAWGFTICATDRYDWRSSDDQWNWGRADNARDEDIDHAVDEVLHAFDDSDIARMDDLIPSTGKVWVEMQSGWKYGMRADDFYDMLRDLVEGTKTTSYRIRDVRIGHGQVMVYAEHTYTDSWGRRQRVYHVFGLEQGRKGYQIAYFRTDDKRPW